MTTDGVHPSVHCHCTASYTKALRPETDRLCGTPAVQRCVQHQPYTNPYRLTEQTPVPSRLTVTTRDVPTLYTPAVQPVVHRYGSINNGILLINLR